MSQRERLEELGHFLRDRRSRILPADAGLPPTARRRVRGLRREEVAALAGIGVSWYTALENGSARGVSENTLRAIADVLQLSKSERHYVNELGAQAGEPGDDNPGPLVVETMRALSIPAYTITAAWDISHCNEAFRRVWAIDADEPSFNAVERLFMHPNARAMHAEHFIANITPVVAMLRSGLGRRPQSQTLQRLRDRLLSEPAIQDVWSAYEIGSPFMTTSSSIASAIGPFHYQTLDLHVPGAQHGIVVQVPDTESLTLLRIALSLR